MSTDETLDNFLTTSLFSAVPQSKADFFFMSYFIKQEKLRVIDWISRAERTGNMFVLAAKTDVCLTEDEMKLCGVRKTSETSYLLPVFCLLDDEETLAYIHVFPYLRKRGLAHKLLQLFPNLRFYIKTPQHGVSSTYTDVEFYSYLGRRYTLSFSDKEKESVYFLESDFSNYTSKILLYSSNTQIDKKIFLTDGSHLTQMTNYLNFLSKGIYGKYKFYLNQYNREEKIEVRRSFIVQKKRVPVEIILMRHKVPIELRRIVLEYMVWSTTKYESKSIKVVFGRYYSRKGIVEIGLQVLFGWRNVFWEQEERIFIIACILKFYQTVHQLRVELDPRFHLADQIIALADIIEKKTEYN